MLAAGLHAADPGPLVRAALRLQGRRLIAAGQAYPLGRGRVLVLAAGKAAPAMAAAAEQVLGARLAEGLAVSNAPGPPLRRTRLLLAGHPLPDARGVQAAQAAEAMVRGLTADDIVLVLLSGGASALLPAPVRGLSLEEKSAVTARLMRAGAGITELNTVRKHLSRLKGGGLARAAAPARVVTLVLSDVVGDDLSTIASGPTVPDPTTYADARRILDDRGLGSALPASALRHLEAGARGEVPETPKPRDPVLCLLAGGETTVTVLGEGRGGRNQEMAVAAADLLASFPVEAVAAFLATDGVDGASEAAGGVADRTSLARARTLGLAPPSRFLAASDSSGFLAPLGDLIVTGPTGTNVVDLAVLLAAKRASVL